MQIKIKQKFNVISHRLGTKFLIVNSSYFVQIFPGLLHFKDLDTDKNFKIFFEFKGPVRNFTVIQNLENGWIKISFHTEEGFLSYKIFNSEKTSLIYFDRLPQDELLVKFDKIKKVKPKTAINLPIIIEFKKPEEFLFLGIHKKQDLDLIHKRENVLEFLPFLFLYSQFFNDVKTKKCLRENCLLKKLTQIIQKKEKVLIEDQFLKIFKAHFSDAFIPRVNDEEFQNIIPIVDEFESKPLHILRKLFYIIKSILIEQNLDEISILPALPISFHAGKTLNINLPIGSFDFEWSKKLIKKMIFRPKKDAKLKFHFQSKIKTYRLKTFLKQKGKFFKNKEMIAFEKDKIYYFDKFQK